MRLGKLIHNTRVLVIIHQRQVGCPKTLVVVNIEPITGLRPAPPWQLVGIANNNARCARYNAAQPAGCAARPQPQQPVLQPVLGKGFVQQLNPPELRACTIALGKLHQDAAGRPAVFGLVPPRLRHAVATPTVVAQILRTRRRM